MIRPNPAKQVLREGGVVYSSSVRLPAPGLCELLGFAGFDFVLLDCEHGAADAATIDLLVMGCHSGATVPVVRVLRNDEPEPMMQVLDLGAQGVLIPHCRTADDAQRLRQAVAYPPRGQRGFGPGRGSKWGLMSTAEYLAAIDDTSLTLALVEDPEGVERIDEIAAVGLDVLWVGTSDLACALGFPGQPGHPRVLEAASTILQACQRAGVTCGFPARDAAQALWAREQGYRAIGYGCAEQYVMQMARHFLGEMRSSPNSSALGQRTS